MRSILRAGWWWCCCWYWLQGLVRLCDTTSPAGMSCGAIYRGSCTFSQLSTGKSGWIEAIRMATERLVIIEKLLLPASSGAMVSFARVATNLTVELEFRKYAERALVVTGDSELQTLRISNAPNLEQLLIAEPNDHLLQLNIYSSSLKYLPRTVRNLGRLRKLSVRYSQLTQFSLGLFSESQTVVDVDLGSNEISVLVNSNQSVYLENLSLTYNRLTALDMAFFRHIRNLTMLDVSYNRIARLASSRKVVLPSLKELYVARNRLASVALSLVEMPSLKTLQLPGNNLTTFPPTFSRYPLLKYTDLSDNQLTTLDLSVLLLVKNLVSLSVSRNLLTSITTRQPVRHETIEQLTFGNNDLQQIDLTGCDFPNLKYLFLGFNRINTVPSNIFSQFSKMTFYLTGTNVSCAELSKYKDKLVTAQLSVDTAWGTAVCSTGSSLEITKVQRACCA